MLFKWRGCPTLLPQATMHNYLKAHALACSESCCRQDAGDNSDAERGSPCARREASQRKENQCFFLTFLVQTCRPSLTATMDWLHLTSTSNFFKKRQTACKRVADWGSPFWQSRASTSFTLAFNSKPPISSYPLRPWGVMTRLHKDSRLQHSTPSRSIQNKAS